MMLGMSHDGAYPANAVNSQIAAPPPARHMATIPEAKVFAVASTMQPTISNRPPKRVS